VKNIYGELTTAQLRFDDAMVKTIRRNPGKGFEEFENIASRSELTLGELSAILPKTARAIERTGARAKGAAYDTNQWKRTVGSARQEIDKVDGS